MRQPTAPRRPAQATAAALLLIFHIVAIDLFVHLQTTRQRANDSLATLLLLDPPARPLAPAHAPEAAPQRAPRPLLAPVPALAMEATPLRDSATPIVGPASVDGSAGAVSGAASAPLNLAIPKEFYAHPPALTPAQEAMRDPRSNRLVLTKQEQMDVDFGVVECIAWQREPDGSIYRGPGHYQRIQGISTNPFTKHKPGGEDRGRECVK